MERINNQILESRVGNAELFRIPDFESTEEISLKRICHRSPPLHSYFFLSCIQLSSGSGYARDILSTASRIPKYAA